MEGHYSIKQAAEKLGVSTKTVRNRINKGEIQAVWEDLGQGMSRWQVPIAAIETAATIPEPLPEVRNIPLAEVKRMIKGAVAEAVQDVVRGELERFRGEIDDRADARDRKLMEVIRTVQEERRKGFWSKLFN